MSALLSYTIRITHTARSNIQKAIKDAPLEEALQKKIAKQECYTELVEIILGAITDLSDVCDLNKDHETYVQKINSMIDFMHERGVKPGCKTLTINFSSVLYVSTEILSKRKFAPNCKRENDNLIPTTSFVTFDLKRFHISACEIL